MFKLEFCHLKMKTPDYDLVPVNAVNQALLLLRDILESQNDGAFSAVANRREMNSKVFLIRSYVVELWLLLENSDFCAHIGSPLSVCPTCLQQFGQLLGRRRLYSQRPKCTFRLLQFCNMYPPIVYIPIQAIRSVIILYQYTDSKLEMIKAQVRNIIFTLDAIYCIRLTRMKTFWSASRRQSCSRTRKWWHSMLRCRLISLTRLIPLIVGVRQRLDQSRSGIKFMMMCKMPIMIKLIQKI